MGNHRQESSCQIVETYNTIIDGKPSSGEFLPNSGKLYIQEIPCQIVGSFKIEGQSLWLPFFTGEANERIKII